MKRILIIGAGVSGVSLLKHLSDHENFDDTIHVDIVDSEKHIGRGKAYIEDNQILMTNVPSNDMSLDEDPTEFKQWLATCGQGDEHFISRTTFGRYMIEKFDDVRNARDNVHVIDSCVENLEYDSNNKKFIATYSEDTHEYDYVYLGIGVMEYIDPYELRGVEQFIYDPYPVRIILDEVQGETAIIGTGLSAIDCIRFLLLERNFEKVHVFSRDNKMPAVRGTHHSFDFKYFTEEALDELKETDEFTLDNLKELFLKEAKFQDIDLELFERMTDNVRENLEYDLNHKDEVGKLQYFLIAYNKIFTKYLYYLSTEDQGEMFKEFQPYISQDYSPMPDEVAEKLVEWMDEGKLIMIDCIEEIEKKGDKFIISTDDDSFEMDYVINATGTNTDITKTNNTLINNLYENEMLQPHHIGGFKTDPSYRVISKKDGTYDNFYALGELTIGTTYLSNSVIDMYNLTKELADRILTE